MAAEPVRQQKKTEPADVFRFPEELIVRETVPGQEITKELEEIMQSTVKFEVNFFNDYGHTVLGTSAFLGSLRCCQVLVHLGAEVGKQDVDGWTALHYALAKGYLDIARYLILNGGDLFTINNDGDTALDFIGDRQLKEALICYQQKCLSSHAEL
ncbi:protein phosphatase 1 regulatory subunit 27-like [Exaiptasia diaphana]|uniref:Uncharacterized protein n=1 Tax=Exaiptasia diaphana TaxID=2652724 RepID=A0A913XX66_EXADI|nr:protein phosphatase 1 regulatory subunit 27-like [Exaiptasia diaphana]